MERKGRLLEISMEASAKPCHEASMQPERSGQRESEASFMRGFKSMVARLPGHDSSSCESQTARRLRSIHSYEAFLKLLDERDPNIRIFAVDVIGRCGYLLSNQGQAHVRPKLHNLSTDNTPDYIHGGLQDEDDSLFTVGTMAQCALISLDCAASPQESSENET
jgi:hypothetical protein